MEENNYILPKTTLEDIVKRYDNAVERLQRNLDKSIQRYDEFKASHPGRDYDILETGINTTRNNLRNMQGIRDNLREDYEEDIDERKAIRDNLTNVIREVIPDDLEVPYVFHGNNNIYTVERIIETGGLLTPEDRGVNMTSFASGIDVTAKTNISTSVEFSEPGLNSFRPYGAIFVFHPKEEEYDRVKNTGMSTEVFAGVSSIKFDDDRFVGIITTKENLPRLKAKMRENDLDPDKIYTANEFIDHMNELYHDMNLGYGKDGRDFSR